MTEQFNPGETIFCWSYGDNFVGHKHILFLGKDSNGENKILAPHPSLGWSIINLDSLPKGFYRPIGYFNILSKKASKSNLSEIVYWATDSGNEYELTVKYENGFWELVQDFQMPSWVGGKDARGTGSKEDCGSDVSGVSGQDSNEHRDSDGPIYEGTT
jgi:hypothetical protein